MQVDRTKPVHKDGYCLPDCPYIKPYEHPHYDHCAWCDHVEEEIIWYDYWVAICQRN